MQPNNFRGTLDGQGHTITLHQSDSPEGNNLFPCYINNSDYDSWGGLFFHTQTGVVIKNLRLTGEIRNNKNDCGTFIQNANGTTTIENCQSSVKIIKTSGCVDGSGYYSGGMIGGNDNTSSEITIKNCLG